MTRCIPQIQALTIHSAPNLASLHLCTCSCSVMQPLCLYPQSVDIHLFIWFQLRIRQPLSFPYHERRLGTCWHKAWARVYAQIADGESSVLIKEKRVFKDVFPFYGGSVGRDDQNWDFRSMKKVGINILSYFCKKKNIPIYVCGKRQEHCNVLQKQPKCSDTSETKKSMKGPARSESPFKGFVIQSCSVRTRINSGAFEDGTASSARELGSPKVLTKVRSLSSLGA